MLDEREIVNRLDSAFAYAEGEALPCGRWKEVLDGINDLRAELREALATEATDKPDPRKTVELVKVHRREPS